MGNVPRYPCNATRHANLSSIIRVDLNLVVVSVNFDLGIAVVIVVVHARAKRAHAAEGQSKQKRLEPRGVFDVHVNAPFHITSTQQHAPKNAPAATTAVVRLGNHACTCSPVQRIQSVYGGMLMGLETGSHGSESRAAFGNMGQMRRHAQPT
jgi:hypothetical protein